MKKLYEYLNILEKINICNIKNQTRERERDKALLNQQQEK